LRIDVVRIKHGFGRSAGVMNVVIVGWGVFAFQIVWDELSVWIPFALLLYSKIFKEVKCADVVSSLG
jgi:hypothetical protein